VSTLLILLQGRQNIAMPWHSRWFEDGMSWIGFHRDHCWKRRKWKVFVRRCCRIWRSWRKCASLWLLKSPKTGSRTGGPGSSGSREISYYFQLVYH